eukprot:6212668-Pleurochrysis_carterae.AAC.1
MRVSGCGRGSVSECPLSAATANAPSPSPPPPPAPPARLALASTPATVRVHVPTRLNLDDTYTNCRHVGLDASTDMNTSADVGWFRGTAGLIG